MLSPKSGTIHLRSTIEEREIEFLGHYNSYLSKEFTQNSVWPLRTKLDWLCWIRNIGTVYNQLHESRTLFSMPIWYILSMNLYARLKILCHRGGLHWYAHQHHQSLNKSNMSIFYAQSQFVIVQDEGLWHFKECIMRQRCRSKWNVFPISAFFRWWYLYLVLASWRWRCRNIVVLRRWVERLMWREKFDS